MSSESNLQKQFPNYTHNQGIEPAISDTEQEPDAKLLLKKAIKLFRHLFENEQENRPSSLKQATPKARTIARKIHRDLQNKAVTEKGKEYLKLFVPIVDKKSILTRQTISEYAKQITATIDMDYNLLEKASRIENSVEKKHNSTAIAIADEELYDKWKSELSRKFYTLYVENENDFSSIEQYDEIRFIPGENNQLTRVAEEMEQTIIIRNPGEQSEVAPEFITDILTTQHERLEALKLLSEHIPFSTEIPLITDIDKRKVSPDILESKASKVAEQVESHINKEVENAQFSGKNILSILRENNSILDALENETREEIIRKKNTLISEVKEETGIDITRAITITNQGE